MCIVVWATEHPDYSLIVANNRDEFLARAASPARWRAADDDGETGDVLCGRDTEAGGTWFGVTRAGSVAALTNFTEPASARAARPAARSRGELVSGFLHAHARDVPTAADVQAYLDRVGAHADEYGGFNLLVGTAAGVSALGYVTNRGEDKQSGTLLGTGASGGVCALSNSTLSTPWPKIGRVEALMRGVLSESATRDALVDGLFRVLADSRGPITTPAAMRETVRVEPVSLPSTADRAHFAPAAEAVRPDVPRGWYGTRTASVLLVTRGAPRRAVLVERDVYALL
ncbi:hypothetical protein MOBT1_002788 [Malassezia obtusa]|uniref:NRDE family protein n=1 Tax=Malassezia obtusa TaxID=76774 RepID=A0AAF0IXH3_9BASI|nr:hypothetical protein MOBT1_002788 [Malassezia obtusa]